MDQSLVDLFSLEGRVAIVTGSTKGLGRAMVEGFAQAGASVVVSSRNQALCEQTAADIEAATGQSALGAACHMGDWDAVPPFVDAVMERFGRIDVLVNNAGIHPGQMSVIDMTREYIDKLYEVNLRGPVRLAGLVAPIMGAQGGGSVINVATIGAYAGGPNVGAYTSVKAALVNYTKVMAKEWAPLGIRVNTLSPGPFDSEMMRGTAKFDTEFVDRSAAATLLKRVADCREIVGAALYFASDASSYTTGDDHVVAGGMLKY
jgi:NAD(P)-dependent dehydrogenase (short-subunit alcohol dehydrogenase family)